AARGDRPAAEGDRRGRAPSGNREATRGDRGRAGWLHACRAGRDPQAASRAVQAGDQGNENRKLGGFVRSLALSLIFVVGNALAQGYPNKPVRLIVTYPPGGSSDLMSRVYGAKLSELWSQPVIVESKPGAAGSIGMDFAAKQSGDGYTFVVGNLQPV